MESKGNKDDLMAAKTEFNNTLEAMETFSNQFYSVIDHVRFYG